LWFAGESADGCTQYEQEKYYWLQSQVHLHGFLFPHQNASLECAATPPQRGCRAGDPGCRRFGQTERFLDL
jgi:hypothetical protein